MNSLDLSLQRIDRASRWRSPSMARCMGRVLSPTVSRMSHVVASPEIGEVELLTLGGLPPPSIAVRGCPRSSREGQAARPWASYSAEGRRRRARGLVA